MTPETESGLAEVVAGIAAHDRAGTLEPLIVKGLVDGVMTERDAQMMRMVARETRAKLPPPARPAVSLRKPPRPGDRVEGASAHEWGVPPWAWPPVPRHAVHAAHAPEPLGVRHEPMMSRTVAVCMRCGYVAGWISDELAARGRPGRLARAHPGDARGARQVDPMTVYVDDMLRPAQLTGRPAKWSHLMADTPDELEAFRVRLQLSRAWLQHAGTHREHYDVTATVRLTALSMGAQAVSYPHGTAEILARKRAAMKEAGS